MFKSYSLVEINSANTKYPLWYMCLCLVARFNRVRLFLTPWTIAHQTPLSTGFSRQEYWSGLPCPPPGDLPDPGIKPASPVSPALQVDSLSIEPPGKRPPPTPLALPAAAPTRRCIKEQKSQFCPPKVLSLHSIIKRSWHVLTTDKE